MRVSRPTEEKASFARQLAERDATIAALRATLASLEGTIAALQSTLINHANELSLMRRRLYAAKSERGGTSELQLLPGNLLEDKRKVRAALDEAVDGTAATGDAAAPSTLPPPIPSIDTAALSTLFGSMRLSRGAGGEIRIEAPPEAADALATVFEGLAELLRAGVVTSASV